MTRGQIGNILTVSALTREIKALLEGNFFEVWVEGEISNLRFPDSGHVYFTLKDDFSQIRAVLFRMQARIIRFLPRDGLHVICGGRLSLYEKRGEYQLILETMEPKGIGALQLAFLQLKERLQKEGLFDAVHKMPLPRFPQAVGIVTSPTGAAIRDMIHIIHRRSKSVRIVLYPVRVQGEGASSEIVKGIEFFNDQKAVDVIIIGRGGGALEDLWAFNEEILARAIYRSRLPVISAVGHETDYTISDFVADLRAPTPSAAAELVVRDRTEVKNALCHLTDRLERQVLQVLQEQRTGLSHLTKMLADPKSRIEECFLKVDDLVNQFRVLGTWSLRRKREAWMHLSERLFLRTPFQRIKEMRAFISDKERRLKGNINHSVEIRRHKVSGMQGRLDSLSPFSVLQRGYSITRKIPSLQILREAASVMAGDKVEVRLHRGCLICSVERTEGS